MADDRFDSVGDLLRSLLARGRNRLETMAATPDLLHGAGDAAERLKRWEPLLAAEGVRLAELEMALAVVGSMKAGKSTTINAIVGAEILPNRNQPMTSVPTLIRHAPGQLEPVLTLPRSGVLANLAVSVADRIRHLDETEESSRIGMIHEPDGRELIEALRAGAGFDFISARSEGSEAIFASLRTVNDLFRLARDPMIAIEPPYQNLADPANLPLIEVEFHHLRASGDEPPGRLTLIDTPGPNEAGQSKVLRRVLRDQLERASAVLAVLDYTQLKSEAEADIRDDLMDTADRSGDRLFVLVNKFDQRDRNSLDAAETKVHVAEGLMRGRISADRVFPVSSRAAYLANRARFELKRHNRLPDPASTPWVADFGPLALGVTWRKGITDSRTASAAAETLWASSEFEEPLRRIVFNARIRAGFLSMESAADRLLACGQELTGFLELRQGALLRDVATLEGLAKGLEHDNMALDTAQTDARREAFRLIETYSRLVEQIDRDARSVLTEAIEGYFRTGRIDWAAVEEHRARCAWAGAAELGKQFAAAFDVDPIERAEAGGGRTFNPNTPVMRFEVEGDARRMANQIAADIRTLIKAVTRYLDKQMRAAGWALESGIAAVLKDHVGPILDKAGERFAEQGLAFDLHFPAPDLANLVADIERLVEAGVSHRTTVRMERQETATLLGALGRWWKGAESDWGYEKLTHHKTLWQVDVDRIRTAALQAAEKHAEALGQLVKTQVVANLEPRLIDHFTELRTGLETVRGVLRDAISDHMEKKRTLGSIAEACASMAQEAKADLAECKSARATLSQLADALPSVPEPTPTAEPPTPESPPQSSGVDWSPDLTLDGRAAEATLVGRVAQPYGIRLELTYGGQIMVIDSWNGPWTIGRGPDSRLPVTARTASRRHGEIVFENGGFVLKDSSTNGSFVLFDGGDRSFVHRGSGTLRDGGLIGLGQEPAQETDHTIRFRLLRAEP